MLPYGILKDGALKKKLEELRIPSNGTRLDLTKRHTYWVNLYNGNIDSSNPRSRRELLQDLDAWERTQGSRAPPAPIASAAVMRKEFDRDRYNTENDDQFKHLIAQARRKAKEKQVKTEIEPSSSTIVTSGKAQSIDSSSTQILNDPMEVDRLPSSQRHVQQIEDPPTPAKAMFAEAAGAPSQEGMPPARKVSLYRLPAEPVVDVEQTMK